MSTESSPQSSDHQHSEALLTLVQFAGADEHTQVERARDLDLLTAVNKANRRQQAQIPVRPETSVSTKPERASHKHLTQLGALAAAVALGLGAHIINETTTTTECRDGRVDQGGSVVGTVQEVVADAGWQPSFDTETIAAAHSAAREIGGPAHTGDTVTVCYTESALPFSAHVTAKVRQK